MIQSFVQKKISSPSQLFSFLEEIGAAPKKGLSQNFLIDGNILNKILFAANILPGDTVLEIGPGPGALTERLLDTGAKVIAIEKDALLSSHLLRLQTPDQRLKCLNEDFLHIPLETFLEQKLALGKKAKVVANLPYHLTTPILMKLISLYSQLETLVIMVQKEVAERMTAEPNTKEYGSLSVFLRYYTRCHYCFSVPPTCFYPKPGVHSAIVKLDLIPPPLISSPDNFFQMTRTAFQMRRKMLKVSLKGFYSSQTIEEALLSLGLDPKARPEQLSFDEFVSFFELIYGRRKIILP